MPDLDALTDTVLARCDELAGCTEEPGKITRTFLSPPMRRAHELLTGWIGEAGLQVRRDAVGNLIGRRDGRQAKTFVVGSHVDTVPNAGKYDGVLGVLMAIAAAHAQKERATNLTLDVIAFSEEEGVRYSTPYIGSRAVCGQFELNLLHRKIDDNEVPFAQALCDFGLDPDQIATAAYPPDRLAGYFEVHIEQGPVLESLDLSLGIVSAIAGQSRYWLTFTGQAGHAGTQPMEMRRDALAAAAEFIMCVERTGRQTPGLRATVGSIRAIPGAMNVVPGQVWLSLDVRHADDTVRAQAVRQLFAQAHAIVEARGVPFSSLMVLDENAVNCDEGMSERLASSVNAAGHSPYAMVSGAGHDAVVMASRCPVSMLFLRSPGGISHHPDEAVRREDVWAALDVMIRFLHTELERE